MTFGLKTFWAKRTWAADIWAKTFQNCKARGQMTQTSLAKVKCLKIKIIPFTKQKPIVPISGLSNEIHTMHSYSSRELKTMGGQSLSSGEIFLLTIGVT